MKSAGILLLIFGLVLTIFTSIKFYTKEKLVDFGKVEIVKSKPNFLQWSPALGIIIMSLGGIVLWKASKK